MILFAVQLGCQQVVPSSEDIECRELPAKYIRQFEYVCGNSAISQWIARGSQLTILEEMQLRAA